MKKIIKKQKSHAFGKDIYLIGVDEYKKKHWLEAPRWDCGWYWGFGYIETYTNNNNPSYSDDIESHQHWDTIFTERDTPMWIVGHSERKIYDDLSPRVGFKDENGNNKPYYLYHKDYHANPYDNPYFEKITFNEKEGWELGELFAQFYFLKNCADKFKKGNAFISPNSVEHLELNWQKPELVKEINEILIPKISDRIIEILTP
jgi:hypothetical protein